MAGCGYIAWVRSQLLMLQSQASFVHVMAGVTLLASSARVSLTARKAAAMYYRGTQDSSVMTSSYDHMITDLYDHQRSQDVRFVHISAPPSAADHIDSVVEEMQLIPTDKGEGKGTSGQLAASTGGRLAVNWRSE